MLMNKMIYCLSLSQKSMRDKALYYYSHKEEDRQIFQNHLPNLPKPPLELPHIEVVLVFWTRGDFGWR